MAYKQIIIVALTILVVLPLVGCGENARMAGAQRRYQRLLEQARLDAARESIEQGRLDYAILLLEDLAASDSVFANEARQMLFELRSTAQKVAQAKDLNTGGLEVTLLN